MNKDWIDYLSTLIDESTEEEIYTSHWDDESWGLPDYQEYINDWC